MNRGRIRLPLTLLVLRDRPPVVLVVSLLLVLTGWLATGHWDRRMAQCLEAYARARTTADSARVDMTPITARGRSTCRDDRLDGTLDRYRRTAGPSRPAGSRCVGERASSKNNSVVQSHCTTYCGA